MVYNKFRKRHILEGLNITDLKNNLEILTSELLKEGINLKREKDLFVRIVKSRIRAYDEFLNKIKDLWKKFNIKYKNNVLKKHYTSFFYEHYHELFLYFLRNFFGFTESFKLIAREQLSDSFLILEYDYYFKENERKLFEEFNEKMEENLNNIPLHIYCLFFITLVLGILCRKILQKEFHIVFDAASLKKEKATEILSFLIIVRESKDELFKNYFEMSLYYFLRQFKKIPSKYTNKLLIGRENLYKLALDDYSTAKERIEDLIYYFYRKCKLLHNFSPILDFLNFVCSRVEDSKFSKLEIIKEDLLDNLNISQQAKDAILKLFEFLDNKSTLYCTFQANNLPSIKSKLNLFLLYMKYYFGSGLEKLEVGDLLNMPLFFKSELNKHNYLEDQPISAKTITDIGKFIIYLSKVSDYSGIDLFVEMILNSNLTDLNHKLFRTFLMSLNTRIFLMINRENKALVSKHKNEAFPFSDVIDYICKIIYVLINRIFIRTTPNEASSNFYDFRGRYIGKNIALRVLELFIFKYINISDDLWPDYIISLYKDKIIADLENSVEIPDDKFYSQKDMARLQITYNFESYNNIKFLEHWLIYDIISPLNKFFNKVNKIISQAHDDLEIHEILANKFSKGEIDERLRINLKSIFKRFSPFWEELRS